MNTEGIFWLGQSAFRIESGGKVLCIDPYNLEDSSPKADLILITHAHFDHCSNEDVKKIVKKDSVIAAAASCEGKLDQESRSLRPGDSFVEMGFSVMALRAYNIDRNYHPRSNGWLGFIVTLPDGRTLYHAGDSDYIPEMRGMKNIDIAFLPVGGTYTMNAEEAAEAALAISPKIAVPMHYGSVVGSASDAEKFVSLLKGKVKTLIMGLARAQSRGV